MLMNTIMSMYKKGIIIVIITDKSHVALETIHYINLAYGSAGGYLTRRN